MEGWIITVIEKFGYIGILLLIALENVFPPIPSEVILTFAGFITTSSDLTFLGVVIFSTIGSVLGAVILYFIGSFLDEERLGKIVDRWGHILRLTRKDISKAMAWFAKYGAWTVFFCRFIPLIRSLISIPAGMLRMNFALFLLLTTLGTLIWNTVLIRLGMEVGESWDVIVGYMDIYSNVVYVALAVLLLLFIIVFYKKRSNN